MTADPGPPVPGVSPLRALLRFALLLALVALGLAAIRYTPLGELLTQERLVTLLEALRQSWWAAPALIGLSALVTPLGIPASPFILASGAVFGTFWGWIYILTGCMIGAALSHVLARVLGRDLIVHVLGRQRIGQIEKLLDEHGFWTLVRLRFVPIPFFVVNYAAALAGMPLGRFLLATALALTPSLLAMTYFTSALAQAATGERGHLIVKLILIMLAFLALSFLPPYLQRRQARRREEPAPDSSGDPVSS